MTESIEPKHDTGRLSTARIWHVGWPIALTGFLIAGLQNAQIWLVAHIGLEHDLVQLALLQPYYILFVSLLEAIGVTVQVFTSRAKPLPRFQVQNTVRWATSAAVAATFVLALLAVLTDAFVGHVIGGERLRSLCMFYIASSAPLMALEVISAALRGLGRPRVGLIMQLIYVPSNIAVSFVLLHFFRTGIASILVANFVVASLLIPLATSALKETLGVNAATKIQRSDSSPIRGILQTVGLPVWLNNMAVFISSAALFPILGSISAAHAAAFLIIVKLRSLYIIPAVAAATALAIEANHGFADSRTRSVVQRGVLIIISCYAVFTSALFLFGPYLLSSTTDVPEVLAAGHDILYILLPTFLMTPAAVAMQTVLEQVGDATKVLFLTGFVEVCTAVALFGAGRSGNVDLVLQVALVSSAAYVIGLGIQTVKYSKRRAFAG